MDMRSTLVIGDIHGRLDVVKAMASLVDKYNLVFLGDFLDSFDQDVDDQVECLRVVIDLIAKYPDKVQSTKGNHELSYIDGQTCSGYKGLTQTLVNALGVSRIDKSLKPYIWAEGFLISHAGVSNTKLKNGKTLSKYLESEDFYEVGATRGGWSECGGLFWCDWFKEFEPIPDVPQIVGHSGYRPHGHKEGILKKGNSYNVDCLDKVYHVLEIKNGSASPVAISYLLADETASFS